MFVSYLASLIVSIPYAVLIHYKNGECILVDQYDVFNGIVIAFVFFLDFLAPVVLFIRFVL